ncbi:hypothetical protein OG689_14895 [Kitasatospora sp. NBC_00240]|uniref:hypothetical protein n=1 Tax=Kitasatospora sp. NBC_00240 TaxID=2903567 RepID=UPI00224DF355|nr:hypothetical protein [Kitasatospora sp. NBC_00240]MCX5210563.1 hypothetical protein [Kitasatospora sp. NBC_00240]
MRRVEAAGTDARIRPSRVFPRPVRWALVALLGPFCWWLLLTRGPGADGVVLGALAAGGWGLGLLPIHADPRLTGPARRSGESPAPEDSVAPAD